MIAPELRTLLAHLLASAAGGKKERWHQIIGEVRVRPVSLSPHSNWQLVPRGTIKQRHAIIRAEKVVRAEYPYVDGPQVS